MKAIVNVNKSWEIGRHGDLLVYIPADMKYFRAVTKNAVVVMGRRTLESFPGARPLKNRVNVVLTHITQATSIVVPVASEGLMNTVWVVGLLGCRT